MMITDPETINVLVKVMPATSKQAVDYASRLPVANNWEAPCLHLH